MTIDEIYQNIASEFSHMKEKEMGLEFRSVSINSEVKNLFNYAIEQNKEVILVSDMYLPKDFILSILHKHSINNIKSLYLSSETKLTKHKGSIFKKIISDLNCNPKDILHIGDNKKSDVRLPMKDGINTIYYPSLNKQYKNKSKYNKKMVSLFNSERSDLIQKYFYKQIINSNFENKELPSREKFLFDLGFYYSTLISLSIYKKINHNFDPKRDELIFIGRDGHAVKLFIDKLRPDWTSHYIHLPRLTSKRSTFPLDLNDYVNVNFLYELLNKNSNETNLSGRREFILKNKELYFERVKDEKSFYKEYLNFKKINTEKRLIIIDSATRLFTAQELLTSVTKGGVLGIYFYCRNITDKNYNYEAVYDFSHNKLPPPLEMKFTNFTEFLLSSNEPFVQDINKESFDPIYAELNQEEKSRIDTKNIIDKGAQYGVESIKPLIINNTYKINKAFLMQSIETFINFLGKEEAQFLENIKITSDINHLYYDPLFKCDMSFRKILFSNKATRKIIKSTFYLNKIQRLAINLRYPISINSSKKRRLLRISIMPYSNISFFSLKFDLFELAQIHIHLGRRKISMNS